MPSARKTKTQQGDAWMSLKAAADQLGQTRFSVLAMAARGELESQYIAGRTVISRASVARVMEQVGSGGAA